MCGICGIAYASTLNNVDPALLKKMTDTIKHRGPDASGTYVSKNLGIGMRRLSIIDIEGGSQPIFNEDRRISVVFNGEIYNFPELRRSLIEKGHKFSCRTDTEVIVHLYEEYGESLVDYLRGMYAFAIIDERTNKLILGRDRIGIKPLYYSTHGGNLIFGSEIKCILALNTVNTDMDIRALDDYLTMNYTPSPKTIYRNIRSLQAGHMLVYSGGKYNISRYWNLADIYNNTLLTEKRGHDVGEIARKLYALVTSSVNEELISDVPIGAFLSGGIDSSTVVIAMCELLGKKVKTFSIGFGGSNYDELEYAREIAKKYNTDHHELDVKPNMIELLPELVSYLDEPFADSSIIPTYLVSKLAREHVTVSLSGDGGDEFFGGYTWTKINHLLDHFRILPHFSRKLLLSAMKHITPHNIFGDKLLRFLRCGTYDSMEGFYNRIICFDKSLKENIYSESLQNDLGGYSTFDQIKKCFDETGKLDNGSRMLYTDAMLYLPDDNLKKVDRMSMANSLEVRVPYLDHRIMEFAASIPFDLKIRGLTTKYIVKQAFREKLPPKIIKQRKGGFSMPVQEWFRGELKDYSYDMLVSDNARINEYLKADYVRNILSMHQKRTANLGNHIFTLIMLELWLRKYQ
ncbi:asparagine synthase (glutamine-hydrolyzing) [Candidatus Auribacterota bacterium]